MRRTGTILNMVSLRRILASARWIYSKTPIFRFLKKNNAFVVTRLGQSEIIFLEEREGRNTIWENRKRNCLFVSSNSWIQSGAAATSHATPTNPTSRGSFFPFYFFLDLFFFFAFMLQHLLLPPLVFHISISLISFSFHFSTSTFCADISTTSSFAKYSGFRF